MASFGPGPFDNDTAADWSGKFGTYADDQLERVTDMPNAVDGTGIILQTLAKFMTDRDALTEHNIFEMRAATTVLAQVTGRVDDEIDDTFGGIVLAWSEQPEVTGFYRDAANEQVMTALALGQECLAVMLMWTPDLAQFHADTTYMQCIWDRREQLHDAARRLALL